MQQLIYLSNNLFLSGGDYNPFFLQEQPALLEMFGEYDAVCLQGIYRCTPDGKPVPWYRPCRLDRFLSFLSGIFDRELYRELCHMAKNRAMKPLHIARLVRFSVNAANLHRLLEKAYRMHAEKQITVYSFWMDYDAYAAAKLKKQHPQIRALARAHAYEIQPERTEWAPYLMKSFICQQLDKVAFISCDAFHTFLQYFPHPEKNLTVQYWGSRSADTGLADRSSDGILTILSCSAIIPLKQLDWMVYVLNNWQGTALKWIHIGDGPDKGRIMELLANSDSLSGNISYAFPGAMDNALVRERLRQKDVDVFVNMSKSEGIPVSVMEAMSFGLPVIAPRINGIPELADDSCGILFDAAAGPAALLDAVACFSEMPDQQRTNMGFAAYQKWKANFCLETNLKRLFDE